ncbi:TetR/AcrR family transcriptional regulator [Paludibacterium yongneupense]|uniref:TetR/AcrR family transcriptional regulator n=1 Tax=Paludibacterium yongneupense TaxID=400061 RepID=UPI000425E946|nr:TetR/AcrR family transcriptional regulator [Paludibacterium yongneupense]
MRTHHEDTRRAILDVGHTIMSQRGFSGVGLQELLATAGIPKGSFYHYFGSKERYGCELLQQYIEDYDARLCTLFRPDGKSNGRERLMRYWIGWLETQCGDDARRYCLVVKLGAEVADLSSEMRAILHAGTGRIIARLADCIEQGIADGSLSQTLNPARTAGMLYAMWLGASLLAKLSCDRAPLEQALQSTQQQLTAL